LPAVDGASAAAPAPEAAPRVSAANLEGYQTAFDLLANRVHASSYRDGRLVIDAGALDFLKYIDGSWKTS
jgi:hypothetical protein